MHGYAMMAGHDMTRGKKMEHIVPIVHVPIMKYFFTPLLRFLTYVGVKGMDELCYGSH